MTTVPTLIEPAFGQRRWFPMTTQFAFRDYKRPRMLLMGYSTGGVRCSAELAREKGNLLNSDNGKKYDGQQQSGPFVRQVPAIPNLPPATPAEQQIQKREFRLRKRANDNADSTSKPWRREKPSPWHSAEVGLISLFFQKSPLASRGQANVGASQPLRSPNKPNSMARRTRSARSFRPSFFIRRAR